MLCAVCHTENADDSSQCISCTAPLGGASDVDLDKTVVDSQSRIAVASTWIDAVRSDTDFEPGADFGPRYRIECLLGQGGMGKVYKAYDKDVDRNVALKIVRPEFSLNAGMMQRFRVELLLASQITHRNILRIHDLGDVDGVKFISMAWVDGGDLFDAMKAGRMVFDRVVSIARQVCEALEAAHSAGIIHRDLKPRNILLDSNDRVFVMDFGLAKSLEGDTSMTRTGDVVGTPLYMAPEQIEGEELDGRADIYAIGLILYEMATGARPFDGKTSMQLMHARLTQPPKDLRTANPDVPEWFARVVTKCIQKDPAVRYQNAREIVADLDAAIGPAIPKQKGQSRFGKNSRFIAAGVAAMALAGAGTYFYPQVREALFPAPIAKVALMPFVAAGNGDDLKFQAQGINDSMAAKLSPISSIRLLPATAVDYASRNNNAFDKIGATQIVEGSIQESAGRISVSVKITDRTGKDPWSRSFPGDPKDLITLEDQIGSALIDQLARRATNAEKAKSSAHVTNNAEAYALYVQGRAVSRGKRDEKTATQAVDLYRSAIDKDPGFALAYTGLAVASLYMYDLTKQNKWATDGLAAAQRAEGLAPTIPEVITAVGSAYLASGQNQLAVTEFERAVSLSPDSDEFHRRLGNAYAAVHRDADAMKEFDKAVQLNPYAWTNYNYIGLAAIRSGDYDKALDAFSKVIKLEPQNASGISNTAVIYYQKGEWDKAIPWFQKALDLDKAALKYSNLGTVNLYAGHYDEARKLFEAAVEKTPNGYLYTGNLADAWQALGNRDLAQKYYGKAISLGFDAFKVNPRDTDVLAYLALNHAKTGKFAEATDFIGRARAISPDDSFLLYTQGVVEALAGQTGKAIPDLRQAFQKKYGIREAMSDPLLNGFRATPEWKALIGEFQK